MSKVIYAKQRQKSHLFTPIKYLGLGVFILGLICLSYVLFPLISWKLYFEPAFASNTLQTPIPKTAVLTAGSIQSLIASRVQNIGVDYSDAKNWFPKYQAHAAKREVISSYNISIPEIDIKYANVSTVSTDLSKHLVHYAGTPLPSRRGNAVIIGHSTLPQLYNPYDYKTILAKAHLLNPGDRILVTLDAEEYTYTVSSITITTPEDTIVFGQDFTKSSLTIITCTPPGTTWKRLIVKAELEQEE